MTDYLINYLMLFVGTPYMWAGKNPVIGFDCSGLICEGLMATGLLPFGSVLSSQQLYDHFKAAKPEPIAARGNLAFFGKDAKSIEHVGLVIGDGLMVEAGGGDHTVTDRGKASDKNAFVKVRPIHYRRDFFEIVSLQALLMEPRLP